MPVGVSLIRGKAADLDATSPTFRRIVRMVRAAQTLANTVTTPRITTTRLPLIVETDVLNFLLELKAEALAHQPLQVGN